MYLLLSQYNSNNFLRYDYIVKIKKYVSDNIESLKNTTYTNGSTSEDLGTSINNNTVKGLGIILKKIEGGYSYVQQEFRTRGKITYSYVEVNDKKAQARRGKGTGELKIDSKFGRLVPKSNNILSNQMVSMGKGSNRNKPKSRLGQLRPEIEKAYKSRHKSPSGIDPFSEGNFYARGTLSSAKHKIPTNIGASHTAGAVRKFNKFKQTITGKGSLGSFAPDRKIKIHSLTGDYYAVYSGFDQDYVTAEKSLSRPHTYRGNNNIKYGTGVSNINNYSESPVVMTNDNTKLIATIINILYTIADNTDKLNSIIAILNNKLGVNISSNDINRDAADTLKAKIQKSLMSSSITTATSKINSHIDDAMDASISSIINAMNLIASE